MEEVFRETLNRARAASGTRGAIAVWIRETGDLVRTGIAARLFTTNAPSGKEGNGVNVWMDDLRNAFRSLRKSPMYALFATGTLAMGIGATTTLFSTLDRVLLRPVDFPEADRLVSIMRSRGPMLRPPTPETLTRLRETDGVFDLLSAMKTEGMTLSTEQGAVSLSGVRIDENFLTMAGVTRPVAGRLFLGDDHVGEGAARAALSEEVWRGRFGADPGVVGRTIRLDGEDFTIIGVLPRDVTRPNLGSARTDLWLPLGRSDQSGRPTVYGRLAPGISIDEARERVDAVGSIDQFEAEWGLRLVELGSLETGGLINPLKLVAAAVALLLLIACVNVANLLLARADRCSRVTSIRAALGAGGGRLARESLLEAGLLALGGGLGGIVLAMLSMEAISRIRPQELRLLDGLTLDGWVLGGALLITCATVFIFGVVPAVRRAGQSPGEALGERARTGNRSSVSIRRGLMVLEVALSFAMLVGALQIVESLRALGERDVGFAADQVIDFRVDLPSWHFEGADAREAVLGRIQERIEALPGVESVARGNGIPPQTGIFFGTPEVEGVPAEEGAMAAPFFGNSVGPGYFTTIGQLILAGRDFTEAEVRDQAPVMLMSETSADEFFPDGDAIGGRFRLDDDEWHTVIGVVDDVLAISGATQPAHGQLYFPATPGGSWTMAIRSTDPSLVIPALRGILAEIDPEIAVRTVALPTERYRAGLATERLLAFLLSAFALAAGLLAAIGLYGVVTQVAEQRTREFGIRISLGANRRSVFRLVLRSGLWTVGLGLALGGGLSYGTIRLLQTDIVGLEAPSVAAFTFAAVLLGGLTLFATGSPARRAARVDPVEALRAE